MKASQQLCTEVCTDKVLAILVELVKSKGKEKRAATQVLFNPLNSHPRYKHILL